MQESIDENNDNEDAYELEEVKIEGECNDV